jgi:hypothetical protein
LAKHPVSQDNSQPTKKTAAVFVLVRRSFERGVNVSIDIYRGLALIEWGSGAAAAAAGGGIEEEGRKSVAGGDEGEVELLLKKQWTD